MVTCMTHSAPRNIKVVHMSTKLLRILSCSSLDQRPPPLYPYEKLNVHILDENSDNPGQNSLGPLHPAPLCNVVSYCTARAMICATNIDGGCGGCFRACLHVSGPTILAGIV